MVILKIIIYFSATFVQNGATFWVGVESEDVQVVKRSIEESERPSVRISTTKSPVRISTVPNYSYETESKVSACAFAECPVFCGQRKRDWFRKYIRNDS